MLPQAIRFGSSTALRLRGGKPFSEWYGATRLAGWRFGRGTHSTESDDAQETWILLHGLASTALSWHRTAHSLSKSCRVIVPELSPVGGTEAIGGGLAVEDGARVVQAMIERESPDRPATLAGNSLGAWIALRVAMERPDLVDRLVLVAAGGYREQDWERIHNLVTVRDADDARDLLGALFVQVPWPLRIARRSFQSAYGSPDVSSVLAKLREEDAYGDADLARIKQPTALIWGEHDGLFDVRVAERMKRALPDATLYRIPDCAHAAHWERPAEVDRVIEDFRQRTTAGPQPPPTPSTASDVAGEFGGNRAGDNR